jgi:aldose sugar dehydrogenase
MVNPMTGMVYGDNSFNSTSDPAMKAYYVYGIGYSFALAKNQITSKLWDMENGDMDYDEINMLYPGFNGGWKKINGSLS